VTGSGPRLAVSGLCYLCRVFRAGLAPILAVVLLCAAAPATAQNCEISPFIGYRFGGDLYESYLGRALDADAAPSAGVTVDLFVGPGTSVSFLYSRQRMEIPAFDLSDERTEGVRLTAEHWHVGGTYELDGGRVRPFLAGSAGVTRYGSAADGEWRFSAGGGGGVKLMPTPHVGFRLDGRAYAVFVDGGLQGGVCGGNACFLNLDVFVLWQVEFTAGLVVSF
jgi:hypothetical protein